MNKIEKEKQISELMIRLYCNKNHNTKKSLCQQCETLKDYTFKRIDYCPNRQTKTFCSSCKTHCYKKDMAEQIRKVMRFSGPRMLLYHPITAIKHIIDTIRSWFFEIFIHSTWIIINGCRSSWGGTSPSAYSTISTFSLFLFRQR